MPTGRLGRSTCDGPNRAGARRTAPPSAAPRSGDTRPAPARTSANSWTIATTAGTSEGRAGRMVSVPVTPAWSPRRSSRSRRSCRAAGRRRPGSAEPLAPLAPASLVASLNSWCRFGYFSKCGGLEVVGPQHPEVVLDELGALLLDDQRAGAELRVGVRLVLLADRLDRFGLDPGLRRVVDTAGQVAVGTDDGATVSGGAAVASGLLLDDICDDRRSRDPTPGSETRDGVAGRSPCSSVGRRWCPTLRDGDAILVVARRRAPDRVTWWWRGSPGPTCWSSSARVRPAGRRLVGRGRQRLRSRTTPPYGPAMWWAGTVRWWPRRRLGPVTVAGGARCSVGYRVTPVHGAPDRLPAGTAYRSAEQ